MATWLEWQQVGKNWEREAQPDNINDWSGYVYLTQRGDHAWKVEVEFIPTPGAPTKTRTTVIPSNELDLVKGLAMGFAAGVTQ